MFATLRVRFIERVARWARKRQGQDPLPLVLRARRVYILPTRAGYCAGVLLFVMLIAGLNYTNSLALLLTFLLAGFVLVGMHECQRTLQELELSGAEAPDCYAGEDAEVELRFENRSGKPRRALSARAGTGQECHFDLDAGAAATVQLAHHCARRGRYRIARVELASTAPFGLFRCWTWLHLPVQLTVYPRPLGTRPLPHAAGSALPLSTAVASGEDEWTTLRDYQHGDSPRSIAWKTVARGGPLMVGQYAGAGGAEYHLSFAGLEQLDLEARLSQLCAWSQQCARIGAAYQLDLPGLHLPLGRGPAHRTAALRALALYGIEA